MPVGLADFAFKARLDLEVDPVGDRLPLLADDPDLGWPADQFVMPGKQIFVSLVKQAGKQLEVGVRIQVHVQVKANPAVGQVSDDGNLPVGDKNQGAISGDNLGGSEAQLGHGPGFSPDLDIVADIVLAFTEDKEAVDQVAHKALGAKADGQREDPGTGN